jgi:hypothetical protein
VNKILMNVVLILILMLSLEAQAVKPWPASKHEQTLVKADSFLRGFSLQGASLRRVKGSGPSIFSSAHPFSEGFVRAIFDVGRTLDLEFVFSPHQAPNSQRDGLILRFRSNSITLIKREGEQERILIEEPIRLSSRKRLEVVILIQNDHVLVEVFDPRKRAYLRALQTHTKTSIQSMAIIAGPEHDPKLRVRSLKTRKVCLDRWPRSPIGRARYVQVSPSVAQRAQELLGKKRFRWKEKLSEKRSVYRSDLEGLARLRCANIAIGDVQIETPWKYMDPSYLKARKKNPITTKRGFRIDRSYKNPKMSRQLLEAYAARFPRLTRVVEIGHSHEGRAISGLVIGRPRKDGRPKPSIFLNGAHHGNEPMSVEFVFDTIQRLLEHHKKPRIRRWLDTFEIWAFPVINPDGLHAFLEETWRTGRKNGRDLDHDGVRERLEGVDLNRNYPFQWGALGEKGSKSDTRSPWYRGEGPATEPEIKAVMKLAHEERFAAALTFHTGTVKLLVPYTIEGVKNPRPHVAWTVASKLIEGLEEHPQEKEWEVAKNLYAVDGTDQDWHYHTNGTLALLVEGARRNPRSAAERQAVIGNVRPITNRLLDRIRSGPALHGRVIDKHGDPVEAEVQIAGVQLRANEQWLTRCHDGHFTRVLNHGGPTTLVIKVDGHSPIKQRVKPRRGLTWVEVKLDFEVPPKACNAPFRANP